MRFALLKMFCATVRAPLGRQGCSVACSKTQVLKGHGFSRAAKEHNKGGF
jgi:hypothetical protein